MRKQQNFQVHRLHYLEGTITLYVTYVADSIVEIVNSTTHLHRNLTKYEQIGKQKCPYVSQQLILFT